MNAFQREMVERLTRIETQLTERCAACMAGRDEHETRIAALEAVEQRRRGGLALMGAMLSAAGLLGGLAAKFWPWGQ
ncbi:MAG: hypothetical protein LBI88_00515 [Deltaproteobacteria bacterium]|jgi:hypothetical protein|nr:hypothetical protein [Deltaproteobacteria bacterium]